MKIVITDYAGVYEQSSAKDVDLERSSIQYTTIDRSTIAEGVKDLAGVLQTVADVEIQQSGGLGSYSSISLRGASSEQVMVFLDGVPLNDASGGGVDLSQIAPESLERIEIYRGATPLALGQASMGGAVNLVSRRVKDPGLTGQVKLGVGSFSARKLESSVSYGGDNWRLLFTGGHLAATNDFSLTNDHGTKHYQGDDFSDKRHNAEFEQNNGLVKASYDLSEDLRWNISIQNSNKLQNLPDKANSKTAVASFDTNAYRVQTGFDKNKLWSEKSRASFNVFLHEKEELYDDRQSDIGLGTQYQQGRTMKYGVDAYADNEWQATKLSVIANLYRENYRLQNLISDDRIGDEQRNAVIIGGEVNQYFFNHKILANAVVRQQNIFDETLGRDDAAEKDHRSYRNTNWQLGAKYFFSDDASAKFNFGRYDRVPNFYELFGDRGLFIGNSDLRPEEGVNADIGYEQEIKSPGSWYHLSRFEISYFYSRADNFIMRVYNAQGVAQAQNTTEGEINGLSFSLVTHPFNGFNIGASATLMDAVQHSDKPSLDNKKIANHFAQSYRFFVDYTFSHWSAGLESLHKQDAYYEANNLHAVPDIDTLNFKLAWADRALRLELQVNNLLNHMHEDFIDYPKPGTEFFTTLNVRF